MNSYQIAADIAWRDDASTGILAILKLSANDPPILLQDSGRLIWRAATDFEHFTATDIAEILAKSFGLAQLDILDDIEAFCNTLHDCGFLVNIAPRAS